MKSKSLLITLEVIKVMNKRGLEVELSGAKPTTAAHGHFAFFGHTKSWITHPE
jgi:hypothetical protein